MVKPLSLSPPARTRSLTWGAAALSMAVGALVYMYVGRSPPKLEVHAHRGAFAKLPPGNTRASFDEAILKGATTLEGDLHTTRDGKLVFGHDPRPDARCRIPSSPPGKSPKFSELTAMQIVQIDCHVELPGVQSPPLLSEILTLSHDADVALNLELKEPGVDVAHRLMNNLEEHHRVCGECLEGRISVQSFRPEHLLAISSRTKMSNLNVRLSFLSVDLQLATVQELADIIDVYSPDAQRAGLTRALVDEIHALGLLIIPWGVNDTQQLCELARDGVDGWITDHPARAARVAERVQNTGRRPSHCPMSPLP